VRRRCRRCGDAAAILQSLAQRSFESLAGGLDRFILRRSFDDRFGHVGEAQPDAAIVAAHEANRKAKHLNFLLYTEPESLM
jgi:hypothetical protein